MRLDHVVLWVEDPLKSAEFYAEFLNLPSVGEMEYRVGKAPFLSVRVSGESIIDLVGKSIAGDVDELHGWSGSSGHPVNHVCLAVDETRHYEILERLESGGVEILKIMHDTSGAQGNCRQAFYFTDPDGNVIEVRHY